MTTHPRLWSHTQIPTRCSSETAATEGLVGGHDGGQLFAFDVDQQQPGFHQFALGQQDFDVFGAGTLELTGTSNNTYTLGTFINEGTVLANKQDTAGRTFQPTARDQSRWCVASSVTRAVAVSHASRPSPSATISSGVHGVVPGRQ